MVVAAKRDSFSGKARDGREVGVPSSTTTPSFASSVQWLRDGVSLLDAASLPGVEFSAATYRNFVTESPAARERLIRTYTSDRADFDVIVIGSGVGGGILADDLADRRKDRRILVIEAGSFLYPTHVYNVCRFFNAEVAQHFGCDTFTQGGDEHTEFFISERPQLNFGGRSVFWSGLIPEIQGWELDFFPQRVRDDLRSGLIRSAGEKMNQSRSMGATAQAVVERLRDSPLAVVPMSVVDGVAA